MYSDSTQKLVWNTLRVAAFMLFLAAPVHAQSPTWQWGLQTTNPAPSDGSGTVGNAVATDAAGRVYVGGTLGETSPPLPTRDFGSTGTVGPGQQGFVAQANATGQWIWVTAVIPTGPASNGRTRATVTGVAVTAAGDVYVAGTVEGSVLRVGSQTQMLRNTGEALFVARLSSAGVCQWLRVVESTSVRLTLATDPSTGGVAVAGTYRSSLSFGSTVLPFNPSTTNYALFAARLDPTGQWVGATAASGSAGVQPGIGMAVGPAGQIAVVGTTQTVGTFAFGPATIAVMAGTNTNPLVAQLGPANQWQWAVGGGGSGSAFGAAYTPTGALWVCGRGLNGTVVGPITLLAPTSAGPAASTAGYVGQLSATGQWNMVQQASPSASGLVTFGSLSVDGMGDALLVGGLRGYSGPTQTALGNQTLTSPATNLLNFITGLTAAGQWRYVSSVPYPVQNDGLSIRSIALDGSRNLYFTGGLFGALTLGSSSLTGSYDPAATNPNSGDVVLGKLINATALAGRPAAAAPALACYPNPARAAATLRLPTPTPEPRTATLADALGRTARTYPLPAHATTATLDLMGLAPGLYVVRCGAATGRLVVE